MEGGNTSETTSTWQPNEELLEMLTGMGISKIAAEHALYYTGNQSAEAAASYVFDNPDIDVMPPLVKSYDSKRTGGGKKQKTETETESSSEGEDEASTEQKDTYKMVFVVNTTLNMGVGKVASQVAHGCLGLFRLITEFDHMHRILDEWENEGEKKIVLRGENHLHLQELEVLAKTNQLFSYLLRDAGRTQVAPNSVTVLALFGPCNRVDTVTGELDLL